MAKLTKQERKEWISQVIENDILCDQTELVKMLRLCDEVPGFDESDTDQGKKCAVARQWYAVTDQFAIDLQRIGEIVTANKFGAWWGRTSTGKDIAEDEFWKRYIKLIEPLL